MTAELKVELMERVTTAVTGMATSTQFAMLEAQSQTQADFDEAYRAWQLEKSVLTARINAYFSASAVAEAWVRCRALTTAYYVQSGVLRDTPEKTSAARAAYLGAVAAGLAASPPQDRSDDPRALEPDVAHERGRELLDTWAHRDELNRALDACVNAIRASRTPASQ